MANVPSRHTCIHVGMSQKTITNCSQLCVLRFISCVSVSNLRAELQFDTVQHISVPNSNAGRPHSTRTKDKNEIV